MKMISKRHCCLGFILISALLSACGGAPNNNPEEDGELITIQSVPTSISISGGLNVEKTLDFDGTEVEIGIILSDLVGNPALDGTIVEFVSPEMGVITSSCVIENASCAVTWISSGDRPSNRWVTVLAMVSGAEDFIDLNDNELFDNGEPFSDWPEPFVDSNDNGVFDADEYYEDVDGDGAYDAVGNGDWDGPCSFRTGDCTGRSTAILFDRHLIYLCPTLGDTPQPGCDPETGPPTYPLNPNEILEE